MAQIPPSILAADCAHWADEIARVEAARADRLHIDVIDGHFVPNLTIGPNCHPDDQGGNPLTARCPPDGRRTRR